MGCLYGILKATNIAWLEQRKSFERFTQRVFLFSREENLLATLYKNQNVELTSVKERILKEPYSQSNGTPQIAYKKNHNSSDILRSG